MIKFFRHIRRSLIQENQMRKPTSAKATVGRYFKYAIGEIILVMIGILLALQVNNWNEKRKQKAEQRSYVKSIKQDLKSDIIYLKEFISKTDSSYQILKNQSQRVNRISYSNDSLIDFVKNKIDVTVVSFNGFNNNTYESMKASGKLDLLDGAVKEQLYALSFLHRSSLESYENLRNDYYDGIETLIGKYPRELPFSFIRNTAQNDFIWSNIDRKDLMLKLNSWGTLKANWIRSNLSNLNPILEKTEAILKLLEDQ